MSPKQVSLVDAIRRLTEARGIPPSTAELARELRVSETRVQYLGKACEQAGAVRREPRVARSWRVVMPPA